MTDFKAAIFDLDGTIANSNPIWEKIDEDYLREHGIFPSESDLKRYAALTYEECAEEFVRLGVETTVSELMEDFNRRAVREYRYSVMLKNGAKEYISKLKAMGKRIALATASPKELYEPVLLHHGIYGMFDVFCTVDDVPRGKGFPDIYLLAAAQMGVPITECAVFEDTLNGVIGAKNSRAFTVGVYDKASEADMPRIMQISDLFINDFEELI